MKKSIGANTILYPAPVLVIGSYDNQGRANAATAAWGGICNSEPPSVMVALRESRYSFDSIQFRKAFTVNIPSEKYVAEADYFGMVSGREVDKFAATGLGYDRAETVDAPFVSEFPLVLECRLSKSIDLGSHYELIGEILDIKVDEDMLGEKGLPDPELIRPLIFAPVFRKYYGIGNYLGDGFSLGRRFIETKK